MDTPTPTPPNPAQAVAAERAAPSIIVVDGDCNVIANSFAPTESGVEFLFDARRRQLTCEAKQLAAELVARCRRRTADGSGEFGMLGDSHVLRIIPLQSADAICYALSVEAFRHTNHLSRATRRFSLTRREAEVLAQILMGASAPEIAEHLQIAENTVQGYYKRLLSKTNSRNRATMVAAVLGWESSRPRRDEHASRELAT